MAKMISASMALYYGVALKLIAYYGLYEVPHADITFEFSLYLAAFIMFQPNISGRLRLRELSFDPPQISNRSLLVILVIAALLFGIFPWHETREGWGASAAAVLRAIWLIVVFSFVAKSEREKVKIMIITVALMFLDESRTYFFVMITALAASMKAKKLFIIIGLLGILAVASVRMGVSYSNPNFFLYGLVGEAYNAVRPLGNILLIKNIEINSAAHLLHTLLQPILFPFEYVINLIFPGTITPQGAYLANAYRDSVGENFNPMGGWYLVNDFVYYGWIGLPIMWAYVSINWYFCQFFFNTPKFPFGSFIFMISVKASPFIFWKFAFYILFIGALIKFVKRFKVGKSNRKVLSP